jgi:DNA polymerase III alpha subunit
MAFLTVADSTASLEAVCFPEKWKDLSSLLQEGSIVVVQAERSRDGGGAVIVNAWPAS